MLKNKCDKIMVLIVLFRVNVDIRRSLIDIFYGWDWDGIRSSSNLKISFFISENILSLCNLFIFFIFSHPLYPRSDFFLHKSQHSAFLPLLEKKHFTSSFYIDYGELHDNWDDFTGCLFLFVYKVQMKRWEKIINLFYSHNLR